MLGNLKPSEKKVAGYILSNADKLSDLSIIQLAKISKTSETTIVRFCRTLGYKGYQDFKIKIRLTIFIKLKVFRAL
jgi:DNA-binding MurR/RpiR family transcriptional regulator